MTVCLLTALHPLRKVKLAVPTLNLMTESLRKQKKLSVGIGARGLVAIGISAHGVVAIGVSAHGIVSIGIVSMGVFSFGLVSMGVLSSGLVTMGIAAFGQQRMSLVQTQSHQNSAPHHHTPGMNMP